MRSKNQRKKLLLMISLLTVTIGFAILSTTLQINGLTILTGNVWDIHWDNTSIRINNGEFELATATATSTATAPVTSTATAPVTATATGPEVTTVTTTDDTVIFAASLELPGDFFEFTIDAVNAGTVSGQINNVTKYIYYRDDYDEYGDEATPLDLEDITFTVVYDNNRQVPINGDILAKRIDAQTPTRRTYRVRVEFNSAATSVPEEDTQYIFAFKVTYRQTKITP